MVALVQRVRKLKKNVADWSPTGRLDDRAMYQPSAEELAEAVAILVQCRAVRVKQYEQFKKSTIARLRTAECDDCFDLKRRRCRLVPPRCHSGK